jgi:phosphate starvation-inducible PhoH-like protein
MPLVFHVNEGIISLILRHLFSPPNNTRLSHLCGPMDEHLRTIEVALQSRLPTATSSSRWMAPRPRPSAAWRCCRRCTK